MAKCYRLFGNPTRSFEDSLETALTFVLDQLRPVQDQIPAYKRRAHLVWWCGHFQSSLNGGYILSAALLGKLSDFGVELTVDNYFSNSGAIED